MDNEILSRFSPLLKEALSERLVSFESISVEIDFEPIYVFRKLRGSSVEDYDFKSHAERVGKEKINKWPHKNDINYYNCSFFTNLDFLKSIFNRSKSPFFACGTINKTHGVIHRDKDFHIGCWLFENSNIKDCFNVIQEHC